jgi:hypothetical protein
VLTLRMLSGYDQRHSLQVRQGGRVSSCWCACCCDTLVVVPGSR